MAEKKRWALIKARGNRDQKEIANLCDVSQQTYSTWETGKSTPSIKKMLDLEKILNTPKEQLFSDVFGEQSTSLVQAM
jgi:transcriptional regulator with XRE-family HTH domain